MTSNTTVLVTPSSRMLEQWLSVQLMHRWFYSAGAVIEAFVRLHDKGLIYQGTMIYHGYVTAKEGVYDLVQIFVLPVACHFSTSIPPLCSSILLYSLLGLVYITCLVLAD